MDNIHIEYVKTDSLKAAEYNPRKWSKKQVEALKESIKRFGLVDPLIVNLTPERNGTIIGGHFRLAVIKELGIETVPVVYVNIPNLEKEKELNIRLNKNQGEFDLDLLKAFDTSLLLDAGFDGEELSDLWSDKLETEGEEFDFEKELKEIGTPTTQLGDLIELGNHKVICGDSTDPNVLKRLCGDEKASVIFSDPVYNLSLDYDSGLGGKQNYGGSVNDRRSVEEYKEFIRKSLECALSVTLPDAHIFYWSAQTYIWLMQTLFHEHGIENKSVCLWIKNGINPCPNIAFNRCYEPCTYGTRGKPYIAKKVTNLSEIMNKDLRIGNSLMEDGLDELDLWFVKRIPGKDYQHATSKPHELYEKAIRRCTKVGDIILDSFLGSGSTLIAAEHLKRRVYGVELEPIFCDVIIRRFEKLTGIPAKITHLDEKTKDR